MAIVAFSQNTPLFKPQKIRHFYPTQNGPMVLARTRQFTYNAQGDATMVIEINADGSPSSKDSCIYSNTSLLLEKYNFTWDLAAGKYLPIMKIINVYDANGRMEKSSVFQWENTWKLVSGSEHLLSFNGGFNEETEITKIYNTANGLWENFVKKIVTYDAQYQKSKVTLYSTNAQKEFVLFSRQTYSGWHNEGKGIYKGQTFENYVNGAWQTATTSTIVKSGDLWVETETRYDHMPGTYKILFSEDQSYREVMKQQNIGWLTISVFTRTDTLEKTIQNTFNGDQLISTETLENALDANKNLVRTTGREQNAARETLSFTEVLHDLVYDHRGLLTEDLSRYTTLEQAAHVPIEKKVYSDYIDVRLTTYYDTIMNPVASKLQLFPNPSTGIFRINAPEEIQYALVYGSDGQYITKKEVYHNTLDLTLLSEGIYKLIIQGGQNKYAYTIAISE